MKKQCFFSKTEQKKRIHRYTLCVKPLLVAFSITCWCDKGMIQGSGIEPEGDFPRSSHRGWFIGGLASKEGPLIPC